MKFQLIILLAFMLIGFNQITMVQSKKKKVVEIKKSIYIDIPKEELWKITADDFTKVDKWISGVNFAESTGDQETGIGAARSCTPSYKGFKKTTEKIIKFKPMDSFTYQIAEGLPKMVVYATNTWIHESKGAGTVLTMHTKMELKGLMGTIAKGPLKKKMNTILQDALEELKLFAETGNLHERKVAAMRKFEAKNS